MRCRNVNLHCTAYRQYRLNDCHLNLSTYANYTVSVSIVAGSLLVEGTTCWGIVIRLDLSPGGILCTVALHIGQKLRCFNHCSKQLEKNYSTGSFIANNIFNIIQIIMYRKF